MNMLYFWLPMCHTHRQLSFYSLTIICLFFTTLIIIQLLNFFRDLVQNVENTNLLHHFALNGGLLNFILTTWIQGIKNGTNNEVFRNEINLEHVSFVINSIMKSVNSR